MADHTTSRPLRSGELARLTGVSTDSLRHYERMGVLARPPRTSAGYRLYGPETVKRVHVIRRALAMGFSLKELARVFRVREQGGAPCHEVRALATAKLAELDGRIAELLDRRKHMRVLLQQWDRQLARTPHGKQARLLDGLASAPFQKPKGDDS